MKDSHDETISFRSRRTLRLVAVGTALHPVGLGPVPAKIPEQRYRTALTQRMLRDCRDVAFASAKLGGHLGVQQYFETERVPSGDTHLGTTATSPRVNGELLRIVMVNLLLSERADAHADCKGISARV